MKNWMKIGMLAAVLALVGLFALGGAVTFAQGPTQTPPAGAPGTGPGYGMGRGGSGGVGMGIGGPQNSLVAIAARALGMNQADLIAELDKGKTIADVAKGKGIATDKIVNEFITVHKANLDAAVKAGHLTQAQADAQLNAMKTNVTTDLTSKWEPRGYGRGMGAGFVDADKDGNCDTLEANGGTAQPMGRGRWNH